jgi:hypothetical protein
VEALPRLLVPNPTQQQNAATPGGLVYDHISLKLQRTELLRQDAFNHPSFRDLSDQAAAWVLNCCRFSTKSTKSTYFLFCLQLTTLANQQFWSCAARHRHWTNT